MKLRNKDIITKTEIKYRVSQEDFKKALGLPENKEISFIWVSLNDGSIEITIKED